MVYDFIIVYEPKTPELRLDYCEPGYHCNYETKNEMDRAHSTHGGI
jgi:hypothetical protein